MNGTIKNLTLISALLTFTAQANATGTLPADPTRHQSATTAIMDQAMSQPSGSATREAAVNELLANIENYQSSARSGNRGPYENNLKSRLKAIDSIWSLGEIGDPRLMSKLGRFYGEADDVVKMNLLISIGKLDKNDKAGPYLFNIAADTRETEVVRSVAFEMLEHIGYPSTVINVARSKEVGIEKSDLVFTGGITGTISGWVSPDLPIGHAGLFVGTEVKDGKIRVIITDCVPDNFKPFGGVRNINTWGNFTHHFKYPYYGNRTTAVKPTAAQRDAIAKLGIEMGAKGLTYSDTHLSQKGPVKFDCVGYTEYLYEAIGLNPTEDSFETGWGWPLTPWEQFIALKPNVKPQGIIIVPNNSIITPNQPIITQGINSLTGAFGMTGIIAPEISNDIRPEIVN